MDVWPKPYDGPETRRLQTGERLIIAGIDGIDRTYELIDVEAPPFPWLGGAEAATFRDTGLRPTIMRATPCPTTEGDHLWWSVDDNITMRQGARKVGSRETLTNRMRYCTECNAAEYLGQFAKGCDDEVYRDACADCRGARKVT